MGNVFSIIRPGARDSENSNLRLGDLASLFTQDDEQDEEQCMTGSYNFVDQSGPSTELQWKHKGIRSLGPFYGLIKQRENCYRNSSLLTLFNQPPP